MNKDPVKRERIKDKLKKYMNREPKENEVDNSFSDSNIINELLNEDVADLLKIVADHEKRIKKLEK